MFHLVRRVSTRLATHLFYILISPIFLTRVGYYSRMSFALATLLIPLLYIAAVALLPPAIAIAIGRALLSPFEYLIAGIRHAFQPKDYHLTYLKEGLSPEGGTFSWDLGS